jgi:hypothetical protein
VDQKWNMLHPASRVREATVPDAVAKHVRQLTEAGDLDRYADRKADELEGTLKAIPPFRDSLLDGFVAELRNVVSALWPATRQHLPGFVDLITSGTPRSRHLDPVLGFALRSAPLSEPGRRPPASRCNYAGGNCPNCAPSPATGSARLADLA